MKRHYFWKSASLHGLFCAAVWAVSAPVVADERLMPTQVPTVYKQECAACHMAYPPGMLPAPSWRRIMTGLDRHYGTDASLAPAQVQQVSAWLLANAGSYKRVREEPPEDRITRSAWFARKHRELDAAVWKRVSIKSAAQCSTCHTQAEQGHFDEHQVHIPR